MHKVSFIYLALIGSLFVLTSCGGEPEPRTRLLFAAGNGLVSQSQSVPGGNILSTSIFAEAGTGNALKNFKITCNYDGTDSLTYLDSTLQASEFGLYFTFATRNLPGKETWAFTVTDEKNVVYSRKYTLTTTSTNIPKQPIYIYNSFFYQKSALENLQYFSLKDGTAYPGYASRNNPEIKPKVDFFFNQNPDKNISLYAVPEAGTRFKTTTLSPAEFSDIRTLEALTPVFANSSAAPVTTLPSMQKNQLIAFKTNSKTGVIRIVAVDKAFDMLKNDSVLVRMRYEVKTEK